LGVESLLHHSEQQGFETRSPARRQVRGQPADQAHHHHRQTPQAQRIRRPDAIQKRDDRLAAGYRDRYPDRQSDAGHDRRLAQDEPQNIATLGAEGDAEPISLVRRATEYAGEAVEPDAGEKQREGAKGDEQPG